MTAVSLVALALLGSAAALVLVGLFRGPTNLDRIIAAEILMVIVVAGVATHSAVQRTATNLTLLLVLGLVGFVGGVAVARFMSRDVDDLDVDDGAARALHPTAPVDTPRTPAAGPTRPIPPTRATRPSRRPADELDDRVRRHRGRLPAARRRALPRRRHRPAPLPGHVVGLHAATKPQTLGLILVLTGLAATLRTWSAVTTLVLLAATQFFTSPVTAHLVGRAAYRNGNVDESTLEVDELSDALERSGWDPSRGSEPCGIPPDALTSSPPELLRPAGEPTAKWCEALPPPT